MGRAIPLLLPLSLLFCVHLIAAKSTSSVRDASLSWKESDSTISKTVELPASGRVAEAQHLDHTQELKVLQFARCL